MRGLPMSQLPSKLLRPHPFGQCPIVHSGLLLGLVISICSLMNVEGDFLRNLAWSTNALRSSKHLWRLSLWSTPSACCTRSRASCHLRGLHGPLALLALGISLGVRLLRLSPFLCPFLYLSLWLFLYLSLWLFRLLATAPATLVRRGVQTSSLSHLRQQFVEGSIASGSFVRKAPEQERCQGGTTHRLDR